jgi:cytoskeletal protein CcmA (bactofilin family)
LTSELEIKLNRGKKMEKTNNYLGQNTIFQGRLSYEGIFNLDCNFKGDISALGTLIVCENGKIDSNIHVTSIICKGEILGNIIAEERVEILSSGKVYGDIWAPVVIVKKGATFEGNCMTKKVKVIQADEPDAEISKTSEVVNLYDPTQQEPKVDLLSEAC